MCRMYRTVSLLTKTTLKTFIFLLKELIQTLLHPPQSSFSFFFFERRGDHDAGGDPVMDMFELELANVFIGIALPVESARGLVDEAGEIETRTMPSIE